VTPFPQKKHTWRPPVVGELQDEGLYCPRCGRWENELRALGGDPEGDCFYVIVTRDSAIDDAGGHGDGELG